MQEVTTKLDELKMMREHHATVHMMFSTRFQFYSEEFVAVHQLIAFAKHMVDQLNVEIGKLEPKPTEEA